MQLMALAELALRALIEGYARDAGVRRLEKQLGKIVRKVAVKLLEGAETPISVGTAIARRRPMTMTISSPCLHRRGYPPRDSR